MLPAFGSGLELGIACFRCCGALMALMLLPPFMTTPGMLALSLYILVERALPFGRALSRWTAGALAGYAVVCTIAHFA